MITRSMKRPLSNNNSKSNTIKKKKKQLITNNKNPTIIKKEPGYSPLLVQFPDCYKDNNTVGIGYGFDCDDGKFKTLSNKVDRLKNECYGFSNHPSKI